MIRREDYRPFPWLVPEVSLDFRLGISQTRVKAALTVVGGGEPAGYHIVDNAFFSRSDPDAVQAYVDAAGS